MLGPWSMMTSRSTSWLALLGERDRDRDAQRVADHDRALDAELVERLGDQRRLVLDRVAARRLLRAAVAEQVDPDHPVVLGRAAARGRSHQCSEHA